MKRYLAARLRRIAQRLDPPPVVTVYTGGTYGPFYTSAGSSATNVKVNWTP